MSVGNRDLISGGSILMFDWEVVRSGQYLVGGGEGDLNLGGLVAVLSATWGSVQVGAGDGDGCGGNDFRLNGGDSIDSNSLVNYMGVHNCWSDVGSDGGLV